MQQEGSGGLKMIEYVEKLTEKEIFQKLFEWYIGDFLEIWKAVSDDRQLYILGQNHSKIRLFEVITYQDGSIAKELIRTTSLKVISLYLADCYIYNMHVVPSAPKCKQTITI